jgi:hypothetical protein
MAKRAAQDLKDGDVISVRGRYILTVINAVLRTDDSGEMKVFVTGTTDIGRMLTFPFAPTTRIALAEEN